MEKKYDVLVVGYSGYDLAVGPVPNNIMSVDTGTAPDRVITVGGDGINAATSFARLGFKTAIATAVGRDMFAKTVLKHFHDNDISDEYVTVMDDVPTAFTLLLIGEDGERHCLIRDGARSKMTRAMVPDEALRSARHLHYASFYPMVELDRESPEMLKCAKELGLTVSMDAVTYHGSDALQRIAPTLRYVDLFIPGIDDAELIFGTRDFEEMKKIVQPLGVSVFGLKCGADGLLITDFKEQLTVAPMCHGKPVDTTGAGDSCVAAAGAAYHMGYPLRAIAAFASANAAFAVESFGATTGLRSRCEVIARAREAGYDIS